MEPTVVKIEAKRCRYADDCAAYTNAHTCNHDAAAIVYCGVAKRTAAGKPIMGVPCTFYTIG